ncbi:hypothetical protein E2C01_065035 [Portunus trituberculatus]|uniref:Uncharacterized protein n=1 Tax=Portunus trituberculatus TaxID=210409 RepID=A0A5B7HQ05_PORTR|nr:hypothetical protein [Portunus trituberculatus]
MSLGATLCKIRYTITVLLPTQHYMYLLKTANITTLRHTPAHCTIPTAAEGQIDYTSLSSLMSTRLLR